ncbi:hypothetical protein E2C01_101476 [Portunus trituberculatus]|uniref:Uncharacterized protein n=1 Tax=Portunus trituberculatus TaxID=210409 RepID=A0A5B7KFT5_PORTR|nr:hypothetical protein [Portunus trituberculatus]
MRTSSSRPRSACPLMAALLSSPLLPPSPSIPPSQGTYSIKVCR